MFTQDTLRALMTRRPDAAAAAYPYLSAAMREFAIERRLRESAFLATIAHESGELRYMSEIWGPTPAQLRYEPPSSTATDLGNTQPGDGYRYRGRCPLQITGRANYAEVSVALGHDFVGNPDDLEAPAFAFRGSAWWWQKHGCNELADRPDFLAVTIRVNGGTNGWEERLDYYKRALALIPADASFANVEAGVATTAPESES